MEHRGLAGQQAPVRTPWRAWPIPTSPVSTSFAPYLGTAEKLHVLVTELKAMIQSGWGGWQQRRRAIVCKDRLRETLGTTWVRADATSVARPRTRCGTTFGAAQTLKLWRRGENALPERCVQRQERREGSGQASLHARHHTLTRQTRSPERPGIQASPKTVGRGGLEERAWPAAGFQ